MGKGLKGVIPPNKKMGRHDRKPLVFTNKEFFGMCQNLV